MRLEEFVLEEFIQTEQVFLWHDLDNDLRSAANGVWSIAAASRCQRIISAARIVGPPPMGELPYRLTSGGVYAAVLRAGNVPFTDQTEEQWQRDDLLMADRGGGRSRNIPALAATVAAIREDARELDQGI